MGTYTISGPLSTSGYYPVTFCNGNTGYVTKAQYDLDVATGNYGCPQAGTSPPPTGGNTTVNVRIYWTLKNGGSSYFDCTAVDAGNIAPYLKFTSVTSSSSSTLQTLSFMQNYLANNDPPVIVLSQTILNNNQLLLNPYGVIVPGAGTTTWNPTNTDITVSSWNIAANDTLGTSQTINATYQAANSLAIGNQMFIGATIDSGALIQSNPQTITQSNNINMVVSGLTTGSHSITLRLYDLNTFKIISQSYTTTITTNTPPTATNNLIVVQAPDGSTQSFTVTTSELVSLTSWANSQTQGSLIVISTPILTSNSTTGTATTVENWINSHLRPTTTGNMFQIAIQTKCGTYTLISSTNPGIPFPAQSFCQNVLHASFPGVPTTLSATLISTTINGTDNSTAVANNIVGCYPPTPPPPGGGGQHVTGVQQKVYGVLIALGGLALLGSNKKKRRRYASH